MDLPGLSLDVLSEALNRLLASTQPLASSGFTPVQRKQPEQFARETRFIELSKQGRGTLYRRINRLCIKAYLRQQHPAEEQALAQALPARNRSIATGRNSKNGKTSHDCCYLPMKAFDTEAVWRDGQHALPPAKLTGQLSKVLWHWFSEQKRRDKVILFPDYDGIGLC